MASNLWVTTLAGLEVPRSETWGTSAERAADYRAASPEPMANCPQTVLEPMLLGAARDMGADIRFGWEFTGLAQDRDGVTSVIHERDGEATLTVRSQYVVGADGARSRVLGRAGLTVDGPDDLARAANIWFRALKLAQMAVGALREWQADQAAEWEAAGSRWQDTGLVFTTATGTPLAARPIRKMFQDVCERAGLGRDWAPRDLRHTFVSLLSDDGMAIEKIARLVGHASSHITETVYRQELRPVLQDGAEVMDRLFGGVNNVLAE